METETHFFPLQFIYFCPFPLFPLFSSQYTTYLASVAKRLTYALWGNNSKKNCLRGNLTTCVSLSTKFKFEKVSPYLTLAQLTSDKGSGVTGIFLEALFNTYPKSPFSTVATVACLLQLRMNTGSHLGGSFGWKSMQCLESPSVALVKLAPLQAKAGQRLVSQGQSWRGVR